MFSQQGQPLLFFELIYWPQTQKVAELKVKPLEVLLIISVENPYIIGLILHFWGKIHDTLQEKDVFMMKTNIQMCQSSYWSMVSMGNTPIPCRQHNGKRLYCLFKKLTKKGICSVETTGSGHKYIIAQEIKHTYLTSYFSFLLLLIDTYFSLTEAGEIWSTQLRSHFLSGDVFGSYLFDQK